MRNGFFIFLLLVTSRQYVSQNSPRDITLVATDMKHRKKKASGPANRDVTPAKEIVPKVPRTISPRRVWYFRVACVLSPILVLLLLEAGLCLFGFGHPSSLFLPTTIRGQRSWIQNDKFAERFLGRELARQPFPFAISQERAPNTIRVFIFGESAAFGDPQPDFGLPRIVQALLEARFPNCKFEVVNLGMTAINSHAILPIARDCPSQPGDIWVLYMGNNEVVGPYGAGTVFGLKAPPLAFVRCSVALKATRIGQLFERLIGVLDKRPASKKAWTGMAMFLKSQVRQDDPRMRRVYANFQRNLADILAEGRRKGARIVVSTVASSLKECAPFASLHRPNLADSDLAKWEDAYQQGIEAQKAGRSADAIEQFRRAAQIDDTFAEEHFRWGQCCLGLGREGEALQHFTRARDLDALRFRCDTRLNEIIRATASNHEADGIWLVDGETALRDRTSDTGSGTNYFYEHVHLTFEGNYRLALLLAQQIANLLPENVVTAARSQQPWRSSGECARRLAWSDFSRREAASLMYNRINDAPFTNQLNHAEQLDRVRRQLEALMPATQPAGLQEAASRCREAIAVSTNDWVLYNNLGRLEERLGDYANAAKSFHRVLDLMPHYVEGWEQLGAVLAAQKENEQALAAFDHALQLDAGSVVAQSGEGQIFASEGKNEEAAANFEKALKIKSYWQPAHLGLAKALEAMGKKDEAEAHFREALQDRLNTPASFKALGQLCFEKGRLPDAAKNFTDALRLDPSDATTHVNLGITLGMMGRQSEARQHYAEAVRLDPTLAEAHARLGLELGRQGNDAGAVEQFTEAVRLKPEALEARLNLGIALVRQHRAREAREQFQEVLRQSPTNAVARKYLQATGGAE